MRDIFTTQDRQKAWEYILSVSKACGKIVSLVQVGSGAVGYQDERSDLDFVIALDSGDSITEVMEYMHQKIMDQYDLAFFAQSEPRHLQCFVLSNLLEIDLGYGSYEHAAAWKPAFKVLFDNSGVVEEKMIQSRAWMDDRIYGDKYKKDIEAAQNSAWSHLMHAAAAIHRGNSFRALGELESVRRMYIDLVGDRYKLESALNHDIDKLPEEEKESIGRTFPAGANAEDLWTSLLHLTKLLYKELEGHCMPITQEMLLEYYKDLR